MSYKIKIKTILDTYIICVNQWKQSNDCNHMSFETWIKKKYACYINPLSSYIEFNSEEDYFLFLLKLSE